MQYGIGDVARHSYVEAVIIVVYVQISQIFAQAPSLVRDAVRLGRGVSKVCRLNEVDSIRQDKGGGGILAKPLAIVIKC